MAAICSLDDRILIDIRETARRLSLSERTVFALKSRGELPCVRVGKALRFRLRDLEAWAESQVTGGAQQ